MYRWKEELRTKYDNVSQSDRPDIQNLWQEHVDGCKENLPEVCKDDSIISKAKLCSCS